MGLGIIVPIVLVVIIVPVVFAWARTLRDGPTDLELAPPPSARLTSNALRQLGSPPWRIVHEIAADRLGGIEHVLLGPAGIFAVRTSMDPLPPDVEPAVAADPHAIGDAAVARGQLDDALRRCATSSTALVTVHWGVDPGGERGPGVDLVPGSIAVDGRAIDRWAAELPVDTLTPAQIDLAWQTVVTAIGRPDPLR